MGRWPGGRRVAGVDSPGTENDLGTDVRMRLRLALREALRARGMIATPALRPALSTIGNAGAVDPEHAVSGWLYAARMWGTS